MQEFADRRELEGFQGSMLLAFEKNSRLMNVVHRDIYPWVTLREGAQEFVKLANNGVFRPIP